MPPPPPLMGGMKENKLKLNSGKVEVSCWLIGNWRLSLFWMELKVHHLDEPDDLLINSQLFLDFYSKDHFCTIRGSMSVATISAQI